MEKVMSFIKNFGTPIVLAASILNGLAALGIGLIPYSLSRIVALVVAAFAVVLILPMVQEWRSK